VLRDDAQSRANELRRGRICSRAICVRVSYNRQLGTRPVLGLPLPGEGGKPSADSIGDARNGGITRPPLLER
jgi:hypothetical protein